MGKKMGINTKAVEARERKETQKKAKNEAIEKNKQDAFWRDDDKHANKKLERQKEREQKAQDEKDRKLANKAAYEREMELAEKSAKAKSSKQVNEVPKVSRHEIEKNLEEEKKLQLTSKAMKKVNTTPVPLLPNLNRLEDGETASSIDQALDLLKSNFKDTATGAPATSTSKRR